jgi:ABC-2 type transport system permease protein
MDKLKLIIQREYWTRVKKKSFILTTLLTPFAIVLFFILVGVIFSYQGDEVTRIAVIDKADILKGTLKDEENLFFKITGDDLETLRKNYDQNEFDGILVIPELPDLMVKSITFFYYSENPPSLAIETAIKSRLESKLRDYKIEALNLEKSLLEALDTKVELDPEPILEDGENVSKMANVIGAGIGGVMGFIMYITVFVYGMMVMRSVMEEKTTRIVEVMISSVKPFQLMMGKIIGVGAVGLTQVAIWAILIPSMLFLSNLVFGIEAPTTMTMNPEFAPDDDMQAMIVLAVNEIQNMNWWVIFPLFIMYFLGGYFLYSSLFAAVGSAMSDDMGEGQALTLPITIPVILALYIMMATVESPNSTLAIWSSIFPLFSPIVMPARLAFSPPFWEVLVSIIVLVGSCIFFVWLSGRIYRVGILMYGKKITFKELGKWLFYKD